MYEHRTAVETVRVTANCDCGGLMLSNGTMLPVAPPLYPHVCQRCARKDNLRRRYPYIEYR